jgi:hypothetical protein
MPKHDYFFAKVFLQGILHVSVAIRTRENYNAEFHGRACFLSRKSKFILVNVFSKWRWVFMFCDKIGNTRQVQAFSLETSSRNTMDRPLRRTLVLKERYSAIKHRMVHGHGS